MLIIYKEKDDMLKIFLVLLVASTVLIGCNDDNKTTNINATGQVTEDMLIGEWKCDKLFSKYERYKDDHVEDASDVFGDPDSFHLSFIKREKSMMKSIDYNDPLPFKLNDERDDKFEEIDDCKFDAASEWKSSEKYIYISNNEFKSESTLQFRTCESKQIFLNSYRENLCKRIK